MRTEPVGEAQRACEVQVNDFVEDDRRIFLADRSAAGAMDDDVHAVRAGSERRDRCVAAQVDLLVLETRALARTGRCDVDDRDHRPRL